MKTFVVLGIVPALVGLSQVSSARQEKNVNTPLNCNGYRVCQMGMDFKNGIEHPGMQRWAAFDPNSLLNQRPGNASDEQRKLIESDGKFFTFHTPEITGAGGFHTLFPDEPYGKIFVYLRAATKKKVFSFSRAVPISKLLAKLQETATKNLTLEFESDADGTVSSGIEVRGRNQVRFFSLNDDEVKFDVTVTGNVINTRLLHFDLEPVNPVPLGGKEEAPLIEAPIEWRPTFINATISGTLEFETSPGIKETVQIKNSPSYFEEMYGVWAIGMRSHHYNWLQFSTEDSQHQPYSVILGETPYGSSQNNTSAEGTSKEDHKFFSLNIVTPDGIKAYGRGQYEVELSDYRVVTPVATEWMSVAPFYRVWDRQQDWSAAIPNADEAHAHKAPGAIKIWTHDGRYVLEGTVQANSPITFKMPAEFGSAIAPWALDEASVEIKFTVKDGKNSNEPLVLRGSGLLETFSLDFEKK